MPQPIDLDAIEAKTAELRARLDCKNPWPSDNESHWHAEGWKAGTRNALDKLHPAAMAEEIRRLRAELSTAERIRENADFHLGQEMARRQLAEKEAARLSPQALDTAVVALQEKAQRLSAEAEEEMRSDLEEKAQIWHEAADVVARLAKKRSA